MVRKQKTIKPKRQRLDFSFDCPNADAVSLAGDFNGWNVGKHPMRKNADGIWEKTIYVSPGTYEYKFLVDGLWQMDPNNNKCCTNCYGTDNNVIMVAPKPKK